MTVRHVIANRLMAILIVLACVFAGVAPAGAQSLDEQISSTIHAKGHEKLVDGVTTALVGYALLDAIFTQDKRAGAHGCGNLIENGFCFPAFRRVLVKDAAAIGITVAIAEVVKHVAHRTRPDGSDDKSFFSEHTALAAIPIGLLPRSKTAVVLSFSVGVGRIAAQKHYASDVAVGAAVGWLAGRIAR